MKKILIGGLASLLVAACSSNGTTTDAGSDVIVTTDAPSGDSSIDPTTACNDQATAVCALRESCSPGYDNALLFGDQSTCVTRTAQTCINALGANGSTNTPTLIEACAASYPDEACADLFDDNPTAACIKTGTLANGSACGVNAQCSSSYCALTSTSVCGTCQTLPVAGAACATEVDCGRDLACATPTVAVGDAGIPAPQCAAWVTSGNSCLTGYHPCQSGLSCVGDDEATMTTGTCAASGATVGAPCDGSRKTMAGCANDFGFVCIPTAKGSAVGTCQKISLVGASVACGDIGSMPITGFADCSDSGLCKKASATATSGTCVAAAADGASCDSDPLVGPPCQSPAKCVPTGTGTAGTCTVPNASTCK